MQIFNLWKIFLIGFLLAFNVVTEINTQEAESENNNTSESNSDVSESATNEAIEETESPLSADEGGEVPPWLEAKEPESITASIEEFETTPESDTKEEETKETESDAKEEETKVTESDAKEEETKETESDATEETEAVNEITEAVIVTKDSSDSDIETTSNSSDVDDSTPKNENEKEPTQVATEEAPIATPASSNDEGETSESSFISTSLPPLVDENFITGEPSDEDKITSVNVIDDTIITTVKVSNGDDENADTSDEGSGTTIAVVPFNETVCMAGNFLCDGVCAKKCNNVKECDDGSDEKDCETTIETIAPQLTTLPTSSIDDNDKTLPAEVTTDDIVTSAPIDLTTIPKSDELSISLPADKIQFKIGENIEFDCKIEGNVADIEHLVYRDSKLILQGKGNVASVKIENANSNDAGKYVCYGFTPDRSAYKAASIDVELTNLQLVYDSGAIVNLTCNSDSNDIEWARLDGELDKFYSRSQGNTFFIYYLNEKHNGIYVCIDKKTNKEIQQFYVMVRGSQEPIIPTVGIVPVGSGGDTWVRVTFNDEPVRLSANQPSESKIMDAFTNANSLDIQWFSPDKQLLRNNVYFSIEAENVEFNYLRKKSVLKIKFNKDLKQGEYECHAIYGGRTEISRFMVYVDKSSTSISGCKIHEATCRDGQCISRSSICDGIRDCNDNSDEYNCGVGGQLGKCEANERQCADGKKCIQKYWICDGEKDCDDGSDETDSFCMIYDQMQQHTDGTCGSQYFSCSDSRTTKQCIPRAFICDGENDCSDRSDEIGCAMPIILRSPVLNIRGIIGSTLVVTCTASGFPKPFINWRHNWGHVCAEPRCKIENFGNGTGTFTIYNIQASDAGAYSCEAINSKGRMFADNDAHVAIIDSDEPFTVCRCNGHSNECDQYGRCVNCRHFTTGNKCESCLPGYTGDATRGTEGDCQPIKYESICNEAGTQNKDGNKCICKSGVEGPRCDQCSRNYIDFSSSHKSGCLECFCNGLPDVSCSSSRLYYNKIFSTENDEWRVSTLDGNVNYIEDADIRKTGSSVELDLRKHENLKNLYFVAPNSYTGNKLTSYGGKISFTFSYAGRDIDASYKLKIDVRILGSLIAMKYEYPEFLRPYTDHTIVITLKEENFKRAGDGRPLTRAHFLMALSNIESLVIRAKFVNEQYTATIKEFSMQVGKDYYDQSAQNQQLASAVEVCSCPRGYSGTSCENCALGYTKNQQGFYLGYCEEDSQCNCNGHSATCDENGRCLNCQDNTMGDRCEICIPGYVSDNYGNCRLDVTIRFNVEEVELKSSSNYTIYVYVTSNIPIIRVYWTVKGQNRLPQNVIQDNNNNLIFVNPNNRVTGIYICHVVTSQGDARREIEVKYGADRAPVIVFPEVGKMYGKLGERFQIDCKAIGDPKPEIYIETPRRGDEISETRKTVAAILTPLSTNEKENTASYYIGRLGQNNLGVYRCYARNQFGTVYKDIEVEFSPETLEAPDLKIDPRIYEVSENTQLTVNLGITGTRPISVEVEKYPSFQHAREVVYDENTKTLRIDRVTKDMEGIYSVVVKNSMGSKLEYFQIKVKDVQLPEVLFNVQSIQINAGSSLNLEAAVTNVHQPNYSWTKDNQGLPSYVYVAQNTLAIQRVSKSDEGLYELTVTDSNGSSRKGVYVYVIDAVVTTKRPANVVKKIIATRDMIVTLNEGDRANIVCDPKRDPRKDPFALKSWFKGKRQQKKPLPQHIKAHVDILIISGIRTSDADDYTCTGTRTDGSTETVVVQLKVRPKENVPEVVTARIEDGEKEILSGNSFNLKCITSGATRITWLFNNNVIVQNNVFEPQNDILNVKRFTESLSGQYTCRASNSNGDIAESTVRVRLSQQVFDEPLPIVRIDETNSQGVREYACRTNGLRYEWLFNNAPVRNFPNLQQINEYLVINAIDLQSFGKYTCRSYNSGGKSIEASIEFQAHRPFSVEVNPRSSNLFVGDDVNFTCLVTNQDQANLQISWDKDGRQLPENAYQANYGLLTIRNLNTDNSGVYTCTVTHFKSGISNSSSALLEVTPRGEQLTPLKVEIEPSSNVKFVVGKQAELKCIVSGGGQNNKIEWSKVGEGKLDDRFYVRGSVLHFTEVSNDDRGYFQCKVENESETSVAYILVEVEELIRPSIELWPAGDQKLRTYDSTYVQCRVVSGEPSPDVEWRRLDGRPFSTRVTVINSGTVLSIQNAESSDFGSYECVAKNSAGEASISISLIEERELVTPTDDSNNNESEDNNDNGSSIRPEQTNLPPEIIIDQSNVQVKEGDDFTLVCRSNADNVVFQWIKDSSTTISYDNQYTLRNVRKEDQGTYTCNVGNSYGSNSGSVYISVQSIDRVRVQVSPKEQVCAVDGHIELSCNVENNNNGEVLYQWSKPGGRLPANHQVVGNILRINKAQPEDAGRYVCTVSMGLSSYYDVAHLEVSQNDPKSAFPVYIKVVEKPQISAQNPTGAFRLGNKLTMECYVRGLTLQVRPTWKKSNGVLRSNYVITNEATSSSLTIPAVIPIDFGKYVCVAEGYSAEGKTIVGQNEITIQREQHNQFIYVIHGPKEMPGHSTHSPSIHVDNSDDNSDGQTVSEPEVKIRNDRTISVSVGQSLTLTCDVKGNPRPEISWEKNGDQLPTDHVISSNFIRLNDLKQSDSGYYICYGKNSQGNNRDYVYVDVREARENENNNNQNEDESSNNEANEDISHNDQSPPQVKILSEQNPISIISGDSLTLECDIKGVTGTPKEGSTWERHGGDLSKHTEKASSVQPGNLKFSISFDSLTTSDSGYYICNGMNSHGSSRDYVYVEVKERENLPQLDINNQEKKVQVKIKSEQNPITIFEGDSLKLECQIEYNPEGDHSVTWEKNESELPAIEGQEAKSVEPGYYNYFISFNNLKASDSGSYTCNGVTADGKSSDSINVVVEERTTSPIEKKTNPPEVYIDHYKKNVHVDEGSEYKLSCTSDSADVTFRWLKDSRVISNENVYILTDIKEEDTGTYKCVGDNQYGHDEEEFHLSVRKVNEGINIVSGENIPGGTTEIECAEGMDC